MLTLTDIIGDYQTFIPETVAKVEAAGFDIKDFCQIDHICYRTVSLENYETKKQQLSEVARLVTETKVNGRPIATFRLPQPIYSDQWRVDCVELPAPKAGLVTAEGLEHLEFVLYDELPAFVQKHADKEFDLSAADRGINPAATFNLGDRTVKFHMLSLGTVTYLEKKLGITETANDQTGI